MIYKKLGRTGERISVVSLGAEHLLGQPQAVIDEVVHAALDAGMNYMDLFMPEDSVREAIGSALGARRKDMMIAGHIGSVVQDGQSGRTRDMRESEEYVARLLRILRTDYIDAAMVFFVDTHEDLDVAFAPGGQLDLARRMKKEGTARFIGMSSHVPSVARAAVESGALDILMFPVNPAHDLKGDVDIDTMFGDEGYDVQGMHPSRAALYRACEKAGTAVVSMKTYGAGRLLAGHSMMNVKMTPVQCIHYALTRPAVVSAVTGCRSGLEVAAAAAYCAATDGEKDLSMLAQAKQYGGQGKCMYCNHCLPCPVQIDVAASMAALDAGTEDLAARLAKLSVHPSACIACGACTDRCPFGCVPPERFKAL